MRIIVTGGLGYIGSHVCNELLNRDLDVLALDNLSTSRIENLYYLKKLSCGKFNYRIVDLKESNLLEKIFLEYMPSHVIHIAGSKSLPESFNNPIHYYENNFCNTLNILNAMSISGAKNIIFSSTAAIYSNNLKCPIIETFPTDSSSPYGKSKRFAELSIKDWVSLGFQRTAVCLRYFNPVGNHPSGKIGENLNVSQMNLMLALCHASYSNNNSIDIYGSDYNTIDGTCERDFVHVSDLARSHVIVLNNVKEKYNEYNIGTGNPVSVMELAKTFRNVNKVNFKIKIVSRRKGDLPIVWADPKKFQTHYSFSIRHGLREMCSSAFDYYRNNYID